MSDVVLFDYDKLLDNYYNEVELINDILRIFVTTVEKQIYELKSLITQIPLDINKVRFIAHSVKGSSYNLMCKKLGDIALEIQDSCDKSDTERITEQYDLFLDAYKETIAVILQYLDN